MQPRYSDPPRPDLSALGLKQQALVVNSAGSGLSPRIRKHPRRQSLPARLSPPPRSSARGEGGDDSGGDTVESAGQKREAVMSPWPVPEHLAARQKTFYARVAKVCDRVSTQPLPIRVTSVTGHGEFFDRGDPIPKHATLTVDGVEDPLVSGLELDQLCSKALAERARRRNEQMADFMRGALWTDGAASVPSAGKEGKQERSGGNWWSQLSANKHLTQDPDLKKVRDGEPLGTVADGVEWALLETIRARNRDSPGVCTGKTSARYSSDVAILVKVARQWAACLTWSRVMHSSWSYPGITARLLKQGIPQLQVIVNIRRLKAESPSAVTPGARSPGAIKIRSKPTKSRAENNRSTRRKDDERKENSADINNGNGRCGRGGDRSALDPQKSHPPVCGCGCDFSRLAAAEDCLNKDEPVVVWSPRSRDVNANLADVFRLEGSEGAVKEAAVATAQRIEMMKRCYAVLRVALDDLMEGKVPACVLEGENNSAVASACLVWLRDTAAGKVTSAWARGEEAVSQVVACIELSIKHESNVSDAVVGWHKRLGAEQNTGDFSPGFLKPSSSWSSQSSSSSSSTSSSSPSSLSASAVTEEEFRALKCAEARQALETDTLAVLVLHAFYLVLPCQPFKFHFLWGRFMSFYNDNNLYPHVARYYTDVVRTGGGSGCFGGGGGWVTGTILGNRGASSTDHRHSTSSSINSFSSSVSVSSSSSSSSSASSSRRSSTGGGSGSGSSNYGFSSRRTHPNETQERGEEKESDASWGSRSRRLQVTGNLVRPRSRMEFRPSFHPGGDDAGAAGGGHGVGAAAWVGGGGGGGGGRNPSQQQQQQQHHQPCDSGGHGSETSGLAESTRGAVAVGGTGGAKTGGGRPLTPPPSVTAAAAATSAFTPMEAAVANECLVSLLAMHGTVTHLATQPQVRAALRREGFPDVTDALGLLKDVNALRGCGVRNRLWRGRRSAALVRVRVEESLFARLPPELFRNVLVFLAS